MATYSTTQMVYCFTFSVNSAADLTFDNSSGEGVSTMQSYVSKVASDVLSDSTIQGLIGSDWQAVWGPVVVAEEPTASSVVADNTMGCYYSASNNMFVIPVAGTNPSSFFDWLTEDLDVRSLVSWSSIAGTGSGNISLGTSTGLKVLLAMTDKTGNTLFQALSGFISSKSIKGATVAVGGHSLGGALSPVLALLMLNQQSSWDPSASQKISVFPTAGPTPGDSAFASYYDGLIKGGNITYSSLYSPFDVVPLAWAESDLETIPSLYDANIKPVSGASPADLLPGSLACAAQINASQSQNPASNPFAQVSQGRSTISTASFNSVVDFAANLYLKNLTSVLQGSLQSFASSVVNLGRFAAQAVYQHAVAYPSLLNISAFNTEYQTILNNDKPSSASQTEAVREAVKSVAGFDPGKIDAALAKKAV